MLNALVKFLRNLRKTIITVLVVALVTLIGSAAISIWFESVGGVHIPSVGTLRIIGVEAYGGDLKKEADGYYLDWGRVDTGSSINRSFYLQSRIDNLTKLDFAAGNWTFLRTDNVNVTEDVLGNLTIPLENFMNVTWDNDNKPVPPRGEVKVTLTLRVSGDYPFVDVLYAHHVTSFNFDVDIRPKE